MPTFFIPAVVLDRHAKLLAEIADHQAEVGIHGYVHNDYRTLSHAEQYKQTEKAIAVFEEKHIPFQGFRNPYLGWTEESLEVFAELGFAYDSNDAVIHEVIDLEQLPPLLLGGYEKSLELFQAIACNSYTLRPSFSGKIVRIPTSIPDDEMLFDRLRFSDKEIGGIWSRIMQRVYGLGGIYVLNLHPERALLCKYPLDMLLACTLDQPLPIWVTSLAAVAQWWVERSQFRLNFTPVASHRWQVDASCTARATLLARHVEVEDHPTAKWYGNDFQILSQSFIVHAPQCPCLGVSPRTPQDVEDFLEEQGYPFVRCSVQDAQQYSHFLDRPEGMGTTSKERQWRSSALLKEVEELETPLMYFGCWPRGYRAALSITGDIDSITIQDFFRRIIEV
jgi:peptidoglycan/xylan/chitin deacetylase (PgdA/CDA1 family)